MARPKKTKRPVSLELEERSYARLERLQDVMEEGTKVGVIQQGLRLLEFFVHRIEAGDTFQLRHKDGTIEPVRLLELMPYSNRAGKDETETTPVVLQSPRLG